MSEEADILIIGGGICGLAAAKQLAEQGKKVIILEASPRTGGRIRTFSWHFQKAEAGPEFIHGNLPLTKHWLKKAGVPYQLMTGEAFRSKNGIISKAEDFVPHMQTVLKAFAALKKDCTLSQFFEDHFTGQEDKDLKDAVIQQAEGFDVADPNRVSVFALREEWGHGQDETYTIKEGYSALADYFTKACRKAGVLILLSKEVSSLQWQKGKVMVHCSDKSSYVATKAIVTISLGLLTSPAKIKGHIHFQPAIPHLLSAFQTMGFGTVVKVLLAFKTKFWLEASFKEQYTAMDDLGFLISSETFPVFWLNSQAQFPVLTAWAGGTRAATLSAYEPEELFNRALSSLAMAFACPESILKEQLLDYKVFNWSKDPYTQGAYSYNTPETEHAKKIVSAPLLNTLYFAGEAFGKTMGTVEAALESAKEVATHISRHY